MTPNRRQAVSFGKVATGNQTIKTLPSLTTISTDNLPPTLIKQGEVFKYKTAGDLFKLLVASQSKQFNGKTILNVIPNQRIHERHLKLLLKQYDAEIIAKAILRASFHCKHVYSVKLVKYFCRKITENDKGVCGSQQGKAQTRDQHQVDPSVPENRS